MIHGIWECTQHAVPFVIMWDREEPPVGRSLNVAREKTSRYPLVARLSRRRIGTLGVSIKGHAGTYQWYPPWMTTRVGTVLKEVRGTRDICRSFIKPDCDEYCMVHSEHRLGYRNNAIEEAILARGHSATCIDITCFS